MKIWSVLIIFPELNLHYVVFSLFDHLSASALEGKFPRADAFLSLSNLYRPLSKESMKCSHYPHLWETHTQTLKQFQSRLIPFNKQLINQAVNLRSVLYIRKFNRFISHNYFSSPRVPWRPFRREGGLQNIMDACLSWLCQPAAAAVCLPAKRLATCRVLNLWK